MKLEAGDSIPGIWKAKFMVKYRYGIFIYSVTQYKIYDAQKVPAMEKMPDMQRFCEVDVPGGCKEHAYNIRAPGRHER